MSNKTTQNQLVSPVPNLSWRDVHGELVIVEIDNGKYHVFNETANVVWNSIVDNGSPEEAVSRLVAQYDVDRDTARTDVSDFLCQLKDNQLVIYS